MGSFKDKIIGDLRVEVGELNTCLDLVSQIRHTTGENNVAVFVTLAQLEGLLLMRQTKIRAYIESNENEDD